MTQKNFQKEMAKNQKYRILHIITRFMKSGGAERNTYFTIKGLNKEKYEIDLAIGGESEMVPEDLEIPIIKIKNLKRDISPIADICAFFALYNLIRRKKYHLVHTHQSKAGILGRLAAKLAGVPIIVHTLHGPLFHPTINPVIRGIYILLEKLSALYTDWFISVGEDLKNYYLKTGIKRPENYSVIRSGMELEKFYQAARFSEKEKIGIKKNLGFNPQDPIVGMVGALEPRKGYQYAIEVAREILKKYPKTKFLFVGSGSFRSFLEKIVKKENFENSITFTGYREDIEKIMAIFDVLIFTSLGRGEGLPQVLVQGAILGKPMVSFDVLGSKEIIKENGFIVPIKDIKIMTQRLEYLLSDLNRAKIMGEKGKNRDFKEWEIKTVTQKTNQLYETLLTQKLFKKDVE